MFNGLVRIRPGQISPEFIEPDLAESWTSNAAGTEWTFKIRKGVQCHHGYGEFTADDAVYSIKRASNKATSSYSNDFNAIDKVEAPDKYTVKITLKNPVAGFLGYVANVNGGNQICKKAAEEMGENFRQETHRHRAVHVRRVSAAAVRQAGRQQAVLPGRLRCSRTSRFGTFPRIRAAISPSSRASST